MNSSILERPLRLVRAYPHEAAIAFGAFAFSAAAMASVVHLAPTLEGRPVHRAAATAPAPPPVPEMTVQPIAPEKALEINKGTPLAAAAGPAAAPFTLASANGGAREAALTCLAQAVYYEAANESDDGQRAVAQVVLNRVRHPAFPASVCGVVYQGSTRPTGCQFTFTCDGSLLRRPSVAGWDRARRVAAAALQGSVYPGVGNATHYHANYVLPTWAGTLAKSDVVGAHLFYRWNGDWGQPGAFVQHYSGHEAAAEQLRNAALAAHSAFVAAGTPTAGRARVPATIAFAQDEGLPVIRQADGRISLHWTPKARAAVEAAVAAPRTADPALRNTLDSGAPSAEQKPLGS